MKLRDRLRVDKEYTRYPKPVKTVMTVEKIDTGYHPSSEVESCQYFAKMVIGIEFWANSAQYEHSLNNAVTGLARELYGDVLKLIPQIHDAIYKGDEVLAHGLLGEIEEYLK